MDDINDYWKKEYDEWNKEYEKKAMMAGASYVIEKKNKNKK
jgi:hypothetical protein